MPRLSVCLLVCVATSAVSLHGEVGFYYTKSISIFRRHSEEECKVCFGNDCMPLEEAKCDYYMATSELVSTSEEEEDMTPNNELRTKVDKMMFDFMDNNPFPVPAVPRTSPPFSPNTHCVDSLSVTRAGERCGDGERGRMLRVPWQCPFSQEYQAWGCIPMVSTYTDCNKENLCTGCTTCTCEEGKWVCSVEDCRAGKLIGSNDVMVALAKFKADEYDPLERQKRSTNNATKVPSDIDTKITFEELHAWMQEQAHVTKSDKEIVLTSTEASTGTLTTSGSDYLAFDEVLSNIAIDNNNISRKKPALEPVDDEYVSFIDIVSDDLNTTHDHKNRYTDNVVFDSKDSYDGDSLKVDLLADLKNRLQEQFGVENYTGLADGKSKGTGDFEMNNFLEDITSLSIVKRDLSKIDGSNVTESVDDNNDTIRDFKNNVLQPLVSIIDDRENELNQLHAIKNSLVELIRNMDSNFSLDQMINKTDKNRTLFSIYKLEVVPERRFNTRRVGGYNIVDMYVKKLKKDIFEVIDDLRAIKENLITKKLPKDLQLLLHSMNAYIRSQDKNYLKEFRHYKNSVRRQMDRSESSYNIRHMIYEILKVIDEDLDGHNSLNQLSDTTRFVIERVIKQNQIEDLAVYGFRISNPTYNLTKDIKSIGAKWAELSQRALNSSSSEQLYNMKLLHLMLTVDINKITDAIKLLEFDKNRRTIVDTASSNLEMSRVEKDVEDLNHKIQIYLEKYQGNDKKYATEQNYITVTEQVVTDTPTDAPSKRRSFLKQIKKLFRKSRQDIKNMLQKKVSKSEIVKELAKTKLDEIAKQKMAKYEDTLKKWQTRLNVARVKRSKYEFRKSKNRMANILPSYLRGKVVPAIQNSKRKHARRSQGNRLNNSSNLKGTTFKPKITMKHNVVAKSRTTTKPKVLDNDVTTGIDNNIKKI